MAQTDMQGRITQALIPLIILEEQGPDSAQWSFTRFRPLVSAAIINYWNGRAQLLPASPLGTPLDARYIHSRG